MAEKPIVEKTFNEDADLDKIVREGGLVATFYIEVQGNDEEKAQEALENTIFKKLAAEPQITLLLARLFEMQKQEEKDHFSGVAEVKLAAKSFRWKEL